MNEKTPIVRPKVFTFKSVDIDANPTLAAGSALGSQS